MKYKNIPTLKKHLKKVFSFVINKFLLSLPRDYLLSELIIELNTVCH